MKPAMMFIIALLISAAIGGALYYFLVYKKDQDKKKEEEAAAEAAATQEQTPPETDEATLGSGPGGTGTGTGGGSGGTAGAGSSGTGGTTSASGSSMCDKTACNTWLNDMINTKYWKFDNSKTGSPGCAQCPERRFKAPNDVWREETGTWTSYPSRQAAYDAAKFN